MIQLSRTPLRLLAALILLFGGACSDRTYKGGEPEAAEVQADLVAGAATSVTATTPAVPSNFPTCDTATCCPVGAGVVTLTNASDSYTNGIANRCIVALGGSDVLSSAA